MRSDPFKEVMAEGILNGCKVKVLRDSGSSELVVAKKFVHNSQFTGHEKEIVFLDQSTCKVDEAIVNLDCPFLRGTVKVSVMEDPLFDVIIGNVPGVVNVSDDSKKVCEEVSIQCDDYVNVSTRSMDSRRNKLPKPLNVISGVLNVSKTKMINLQNNDESLLKVREQAVPFDLNVQVKSFVTKDRLFHRISPNNNLQLVVPKDLRGEVMKIAHEGLLAGHMGIANTFGKVSSQFYWPRYSQDIEEYVKSCHQCQMSCYKGKIGKAPLQKMPLISTPFSRIALDLIGPLHPPSDDGHRYILSVVDYATRYPEAVALKTIDSITVAEALIDIYSRVGVPEEILTDQGAQFVSGIMKEVSRLLSIKQLRTTPYHPQCNGLVERFNGTLKAMLRKMTQEKPKTWHRYLPALLFAVRETPQSATGFSPFELIYGRSVRGPMLILREAWTEEQKDPETWSEYEYVFNLRNKLEDTCRLAQESLDLSQRKYKKYFDQHSRFRSLKTGDKVLLLLPTDNNKLSLKWRGPYDVLAAKGNNDYLIDLNGNQKIYHINMLKQYHQRDDNSDPIAKLDQGSKVVAIAVVADEDDSLFPHSSVESLETLRDVKIDSNLTEEQKYDLSKVLHAYSPMFTDLPGETNQLFHSIDVTSTSPVRSRPYNVPHARKNVIREEVSKMLNLGVITPSKSPYASPVVLVNKPDGSNRFCIDYRKLNKITIFDAEPVPNVESIFAKIGRAKYFTKIDMTKGYWQIPVHPNDREKTAFICEEGLFEFIRMPFGLVNAGATFSRLMRKILGNLDNVINYIDDILIFTESWEKHLGTLQKVLERLREANLTVRPSKCLIGYGNIPFLGHNIV